MQIEQSNDYGRFKILQFNRRISKGHVAQLVEAFQEKPNILQYRPILTNEKLEVVDGQHRFEAAKSLGYPIYYTVGKGLNYKDAQKFNALQRNWTPIDYAESFAKAGDKNYQKYLDFRKRFCITHNVTVAYLAGNTAAATDSASFRNGAFKVANEKTAEKHCIMLTEVGDKVPEFWNRKEFGIAYFTLLNHPDYDHKHFLYKLAAHHAKFLARYENMQDYQRAFERIYNFKTPVEQQIKLF
jgi:hypothetical protein